MSCVGSEGGCEREGVCVGGGGEYHVFPLMTKDDETEFLKC